MDSGHHSFGPSQRLKIIFEAVSQLGKAVCPGCAVQEMDKHIKGWEPTFVARPLFCLLLKNPHMPRCVTFKPLCTQSKGTVIPLPPDVRRLEDPHCLWKYKPGGV